MEKLMLDYTGLKVKSISGRYITNKHVDPFMASLSKVFIVENIGHSVNGAIIKSVTLGSGPMRILMWSQMHGNESTTTKALLDMFQAIEDRNPFFDGILEKCTLKIIPILNPDGAKAYTRWNANGIDLNRDAQNLSQPESKVLRSVYDSFEPHFGFNLHGQRTIFSAGNARNSATLSFLAPAFDPERNVSPNRAKGMQLIAAMNAFLQPLIPNQVGRYDDAFNADCVGDAFQINDTITVLFEAGHFPGDYEREKTRELIFLSISKALKTIAEDSLDRYTMESYLQIPENEKLFYDLLLSNVHIINPKLSSVQKVGLLYKETLKDGKIIFIPTTEQMTWNAKQCYGHLELDCAIETDLKWLKDNNIPRLLM